MVDSNLLRWIIQWIPKNYKEKFRGGHRCGQRVYAARGSGRSLADKDHEDTKTNAPGRGDLLSLVRHVVHHGVTGQSLESPAVSDAEAVFL